MIRTALRLAALAALAASCGQAGAGVGAGNGDGNGHGNGGGGPARAGDAGGAAPSPSGERRSDGDGAARARPAPVSWLKGSTHVHTVHSGDSRIPVDDVVDWYRDHGYDFIFITDHNRITPVDESRGRPLLLRGIELTHNPGSCDPPPPDPDGKCRIHLNGLAVGEPRVDLTDVAALASVADAPDGGGTDARPPVVEWKNHGSSSRLDMYQAGIDKIVELGGLVQVNHPRWHWGVDGKLLAELGRRGAMLVEVANMGFARWNAGNSSHQSAEAMWDAALSEGVLVYGVASDDAHHYRDAEIDARRAAGSPVYPAGTGWIMVRASRRPDAIRRALARGDFYASTGVTLERVDVADGSIEIEVARDSAGEHEIAFIGQGGSVLEATRGRGARFALDEAPAGYVRAVVTRADGARAWTQPVRVPRADPPR